MNNIPVYTFMINTLVTYFHVLAPVTVLCPLTSCSQKLQAQSLPNLVCSFCRVRRQNFMTPTPRGGNFRVGSVKLMYFLKNLGMVRTN